MGISTPRRNNCDGDKRSGAPPGGESEGFSTIYDRLVDPDEMTSRRLMGVGIRARIESDDSSAVYEAEEVNGRVLNTHLVSLSRYFACIRSIKHCLKGTW